MNPDLPALERVTTNKDFSMGRPAQGGCAAGENQLSPRVRIDVGVPLQVSLFLSQGQKEEALDRVGSDRS